MTLNFPGKTISTTDTTIATATQKDKSGTKASISSSDILLLPHAPAQSAQTAPTAPSAPSAPMSRGTTGTVMTGSTSRSSGSGRTAAVATAAAGPSGPTWAGTCLRGRRGRRGGAPAVRRGPPPDGERGCFTTATSTGMTSFSSVCLSGVSRQ